MTCDFVTDNGADHRARCRMAGIAITNFMSHHTANHAAQDNRRGGRTVMTAVMRRAMMPRPVMMRCVTAIVTIIVAMTRLMPSAMLARMRIMALDVGLAVNLP